MVLKQKTTKKPPYLSIGRSFTTNRLFSFETVATGTAFCIAAARIAYVDFVQGAIIPCLVVLAIGYVTTDAGVNFTSFHDKNPPYVVNTVYPTFKKILTFSKFSCTIVEK